MVVVANLAPRKMKFGLSEGIYMMLVGPIGIYIRSHVVETPEFLDWEKAALADVRRMFNSRVLAAMRRRSSAE